jgi:phosphoribosylformylglycinamidine synthase
MTVDGEKMKETLFQMVKSTLGNAEAKAAGNSIIAFHDNSSAIRGVTVTTIQPSDPSTPSPMAAKNLLLHPILTAETHNFPSGVAPFAGAETGTGGRLRDVMATGQVRFPS